MPVLCLMCFVNTKLINVKNSHNEKVVIIVYDTVPFFI